MSEGLSHCEIAAAWSEQRGYAGPIKVWRPRPRAPEPTLPMDGPRTLEAMVAAHKARQARLKAAALTAPPSPPPPTPAPTLAEREIVWAKERKAQETAREIALALSTIPGPSLRKVVGIVSAAYGISPHDLLGHSREHRCTLPRHIAIYLCKTTTRLSRNQISKGFSHRDHTTVCYAIEKVSAWMAVDDGFRAKVEALREALTEAQAE